MFRVLIVGGPAEAYIEKCLYSISKQTYKHWTAQVILDPVGDQTYENALKVRDFRIAVKLNSNRCYAIPNLLEAARLQNPYDDDILFTIDADDWLATDNAFEIVNGYYERNPELLVTHGSWTSVPDPNCPNNNAPYTAYEYGVGIRHVPWRGSHLRTFKYKVWKHIKDEDLKDATGKYYETAWDLALMWPMLEMAGLKRIQFIPEILYVYNQETAYNDAKKRCREQMYNTDYLAAKPPYPFLEKF